jgi:alpha-tubulin suppressor-like RCC1 family protein
MKLETAKCTVCGASLKLSQDKAISECSYCKSQIIVSNALDFNKVEVDKSKDIVKYRDNLKKYIRNNSIEEILRVSNQILDILPKDFLASYFAAYAHQVKGEPNYIYEFYSNILEHTPNELEEVVEHINKRSDLRDDNRIFKFLNKTDESYADKYKQIHLTRLELEDNYADIPRDIFLSYKSKDDNQLIEKIVSRLEDEGYSVWVSYRNLRPNDNENYWSSIEKAIKNSNIFLVVSEAASMRSKDVQKELDFAITYNKRLIEFKIDQTPHTQLFKHVFDGIKWVEGVSLKKGLEALTERIFEEKEVIKDLIANKQWKGYIQPSYQVMSPKTKKLGLIIGAGVIALALLVGFSLNNRIYEITNNNSSITDSNSSSGNVLKYTVAYETDGGIVNGLKNELALEDLPYVIPTPFKVDNNFLGWFHSSYNTESRITELNENNINDVREVYAKWQLNKIEIIYKVEEKVQFFAGSSSTHHVFKTSFDRYFAIGDNSRNQFGVNSKSYFQEIEYNKIINLNLFEEIVKIQTGSFYTFILTNEGRLFGYGDSYYFGDLTRFKNNELTDLFDIGFDDLISDISLESGHLILTTQRKRVFTWGSNFNGQAGTGYNSDKVITLPKEITDEFEFGENEIIKEIRTPQSSSSLVTNEKIYVWGYHPGIQTTNPNPSIPGIFSPLELTANYLNLFEQEKIESFIPTGDANYIITNIRYLVTGFNLLQKLNTNNFYNYTSIPVDITEKLNLLEREKIKLLSGGNLFGIAVTTLNRILVWGNDFGEYPKGIFTNSGPVIYTEPFDVTSRVLIEKDDTIVDMQTGWKFVTLLTQSGKIITWGADFVDASKPYIENGNFIGVRDHLPKDLLKVNDIEFENLVKVISLESDTQIEEFVPSLNGFNFLGWYKDESYKIPFDEARVSQSITTLFAKFRKS